LRPQSNVLFTRELKHEISGKPGEVPSDLLIEALGAHAIQCGEIGIEHNSAAAQDADGTGEEAQRRPARQDAAQRVTY
jgi:hypothetical protein